LARLQAWKALADARDFERLFESVVRDSGVLRREIFFADGERELTNYLHVLELLLEHANRTRATLGDLVHALTGLIEETRFPLDLEGNVQRLESERRAVQIMTIHKSKGLEAPIVFVAGGASAGRSDDVRVYHEGGRRLAWVGRTRGDVKMRVQEEEREEEQRLMYVALTRAKGRLYLPCAMKEGDAAKLRGAYDVVNRRVAALLRDEAPSLSVEDAPLVVAVPSAPANDVHADSWSPPMALLRDDGDAAGDEAKLRERHAGAIVTSYTRMKGARGASRSTWIEEAEDRRAEKAGEAADEALPTTLRATRASGVFVHEVLERVALASFASPTREAWRARAEVAALFDEAMAVHRVDPAQREHAEQLVWTAYTTPLALPGGVVLARLADAARVVREMDFVFPVAAAMPVYVRGSLDLAFEHGVLTYFADWKTDALASYDPAALGRHVEAHYAEQVQLYALAIVKLLGVATREEYEARFGGLLYGFLRGLDADGRGLWSARPSWDEVLAWEQALRARRSWGGGRGT
jgi:exodeoxyribonuclease V beta subunit